MQKKKGLKRALSLMLLCLMVILESTNERNVMASTLLYEAESAILSGGAVVENNHSGYSGNGFVGGFTDSNKGYAKAEFQVQASDSGDYVLNLRYANGNGTTKTLSLLIDGVFQKQIELTATSNWDSWNSLNETLTLNAGNHTISYYFGWSDSGNVNIDCVSLELIEEEPEEINLALGKEVTSNGTVVGYEVTKINDANMDTYYEGIAGSLPNEVTFDLEESYEINNIVLQLNPSWGDRTQRISVLVSQDGQNYDIAVSEKDYQFTQGNVVVIMTNDLAGRFVRLQFISNTGAGGGQAAEVEIYGLLTSQTPTVTPTPTAAPTPTPTPSATYVVPGKIEAEAYEVMNGIDTENCSEGTLNVGWVHSGDWLDYSVNVATAGTYKVEYRLAGVNNTTQIQLKSGSTTLATTNIVNTGDWQTYQTVTSSTFNLSAGEQTIRLYFTGEGLNLNYINIVDSTSTPHGKPDLIITDIMWTPANPLTGDEVTYSAVIKNQGTEASPEGIIQGVVFIVDGTIVNWSDNYTYSIAVGSSVTVTATGGPNSKATWKSSTGTHTIRAMVDDINRIVELDENNNSLEETIIVNLPSKPDLVVTDVTWAPVAPEAGDSVIFIAVVENKGTAATPDGTACDISFIVNGTRVSWVSNYTSSIAVGGKVTLTQNGGAWTAANGIHAVNAVVDDSNLINELEESNNTTGKSLYIGVVESYGATVPYDTYEAESLTINGASIIGPDTTWCTPESEASGRKAVRLAQGQSIELTLENAAQGIVVRYSMPDSATGADIYQNLSLYVNGVHNTDISLTNRYSHQYGQYGSDGGEMQWSNTPGINHHRFFDECRILLGQQYAEGTSIKLQWDVNDYNPDGSTYLLVDFIEAEAVAAPLDKPSDYVSIVSYGATANDGTDDTAAMSAAIAAVNGTTIKGVWLPEGTFDFNVGTRAVTKIKLPSGVSMKGAGIWYSTLQGAYAGILLQGGNVTLSDFTIKAEETYRSNSSGIASVEGNALNSTITNIWMQHSKVGLWLNEGTANALISKCRIRDTWADGININGGTNNTIVEQCNFRNTGDDGMAMWSKSLNGGTGTVDNCTFRYNTIQIPNLANGIGIYGGKDNTISHNLIQDVVDNGSGIQFGTNHAPTAFIGTLTVNNNKLVRCGSWHHDYGYQIGAIWGYWINNNGLAQNLSVNVNDNLLDSSTYSGIFTEESSIGSNVVYTSNTINNSGSYGVHIRDSARGTAVLNSNTVNGAVLEKFKNDSPNFTVSGTGNNW